MWDGWFNVRLKTDASHTLRKQRLLVLYLQSFYRNVFAEDDAIMPSGSLSTPVQVGDAMTFFVRNSCTGVAQVRRICQSMLVGVSLSSSVTSLQKDSLPVQL